MGYCTFFSVRQEESKTEIEYDHFSSSVNYQFEETLKNEEGKHYYALLNLERPIFCTETSVLIGSKLDADVNTKACRLAFHGTIEMMHAEPTYDCIKIYKTKQKTGVIERVTDENMAVAKDMFVKGTDLTKFIGLKLDIEGSQGVIDSSFGKSGKFKVYFPNYDAKIGQIVLTFKRFSFDKSCALVQ